MTDGEKLRMLTRGVIVSFVQSYKYKPPETSNVDWLENEFSKYPEIWKDGEARNAAETIVETASGYDKASGTAKIEKADGKESKSAEEDAQEFAEKAIKSGASAGLTIAAAGGITVATKNGWLGDTLKNRPVQDITKTVNLGVEDFARFYIFAPDTKGAVAGATVGSVIPIEGGVIVGAVIGSVAVAVTGLFGSRETPASDKESPAVDFISFLQLRLASGDYGTVKIFNSEEEGEA
ncbi:MAG: hypothetical protein FWG66_10145 [Spirochaetes bacterium]|nr:hypothetical protein [Spirochaetota bacterium]